MTSAPTIAVACQGGGSHAAFTAGVLRTLLAEEARGDFRIIEFSGTSGGALSALLAWYGLLTGGTDTALTLLRDLWQENAASTPYEWLTNESVLAAVRAPVSVDGSPYEFPLSWMIEQQLALARTWGAQGGWGPRETFVDMESLLRKFVMFAEGPVPRKVLLPGPPVRRTRLLVGAVDIISGEFEAFDSALGTDTDGQGFDSGGISLEAILASAALPMIFRAVRIGAYAYWDGLFSQNPPIKEFVAGPRIRTAAEKPDQIWVIQINPQRGTEPTSPAEIEERRRELAGNLSLNQEIGFIRTINKVIRDIKQLELAAKDVYKPIEVRRIAMNRERLGRELGRKVDMASKLDRSRQLIDGLMAHGEERAAEFLSAWRAGEIPSET